MKEKERQLIIDTEEVSALLVILISIQWVSYGVSLPIFYLELFYYPGWCTGLFGFLFYSYFLIEVGFLKVFYRFRNARLV